MGMTIDGLERECQYCYREIDNSGLEGFRCTNRTAIKARDSSWCYPKNANEPCSICEYCKPKQNTGMTIDEHIEVLKSYHNGFTGYVGNLQDSIDVAVTIMEKYQKIEQILNDWKEMGYSENDGLYSLISEVVEDGTN